jgi:hypothetical protein
MKKLVVICTEPPEERNLLGLILRQMLSPHYRKLEVIEVKYEGNGLMTVKADQVEYMVGGLLGDRGLGMHTVTRNGLYLW